MVQNNRIVIISGYGGHGKSEFCKICKELTNEKSMELSSIDWPKQVADYCGADRNNKTEEYRLFLSRLKWALEEFDGSPSNKVIENLKIFINQYCMKDYIFFVNIREPQRIDEFKDKCKKELGIGCITLFLSNPNLPIITSNKSDARAKQYKYDYYIQNDSDLEMLKEKAQNFIDKIKEVEK